MPTTLSAEDAAAAASTGAAGRQRRRGVSMSGSEQLPAGRFTPRGVAAGRCVAGLRIVVDDRCNNNVVCRNKI